jgi:hypothetical protein
VQSFVLDSSEHHVVEKVQQRGTSAVTQCYLLLLLRFNTSSSTVHHQFKQGVESCYDSGKNYDVCMH